MKSTACAFLAAIGCAAASAEITHELRVVDNGCPTINGMHVYTVQLVCNVSGPQEDWLLTQMQASIDALAPGIFYQHPLGGDLPVSPAVYADFPEIQWDSWYTGPAGFPNTAFPGILPSFASTPAPSPTELFALWFDLAASDNGDFVIAQISIRYPINEPPPQMFLPNTGLLAQLSGLSGAKSDPTSLVPFSFSIYRGLTGTAPCVPSAPCPADLSGDGEVGQADLNILLASFESGPGGDIDGDGDTDQADLNLLLAAFGQPCPG